QPNGEHGVPGQESCRREDENGERRLIDIACRRVFAACDVVELVTEVAIPAECIDRQVYAQRQQGHRDDRSSMPRSRLGGGVFHELAPLRIALNLEKSASEVQREAWNSKPAAASFRSGWIGYRVETTAPGRKNEARGILGTRVEDRPAGFRLQDGGASPSA